MRKYHKLQQTSRGAITEQVWNVWPVAASQLCYANFRQPRVAAFGHPLHWSVGVDVVSP